MKNLDIHKKMRDPAGNIKCYETEVGYILERDLLITAHVPESLDQEIWFKIQTIGTTLELIIHKYGMGDSIEAIRAVVLGRSDLIAENSEFVRVNGAAEHSDFSAVDGIRRVDVAFTAIALLLVELPHYLDVFRRLLSTKLEGRSYVMDLLIKSFIPDRKLLNKYQSDRHARAWMEPFLRALATDPDRRSADLATYMNNWCRTMRPWGWKPDLNPGLGKDRLFCDFAFEVALAVCAYDIDDTAFNDHPYYPRDLVCYYRANIRKTRDAWRPLAAGPGVAIIAPPPPIKADLAKTKRKGIARWIELACDGNADATESILEVIGKPRKLDDLEDLMGALSDASHAIHADIKDDETTLNQAGRVAQERGLGEFNGLIGPPFGPARCSAGLLAFASWLKPHGYCLVDLDNEDDAWRAVVVKADYHTELISLSRILKIRTHTPDAVYGVDCGEHVACLDLPDMPREKGG